MGDSLDGPAEEPDDDDTDWARLYSLSPNLWSDYLAEFEELVNTGQATPADYVRFYERCRQAVRCLSDTDARLPGLGLSFARFVDLREKAIAAELAAFERYVAVGENETVLSRTAREYRRPTPADGPLSRELADLILNLGLRGLDDKRIACALDIHDTWPAIVRGRTRLHPGAANVVAAHIAGMTLGQIAKETGVPASSALRILKMIGERPHGVTVRVDARSRANTIVKLRAKGLSYKEITERVGCSMDVVKNVLRTKRRHRYEGGTRHVSE